MVSNQLRDPQGRAAQRRYAFVQDADSEMPTPSIDGLADPVIAVDTSGILRYGNDRAIDVLGWSDDDSSGNRCSNWFTPTTANIVLASIATVITKPYGELLRIRARHGRGTWIHLEIRGAVQTLDDEELIVLVAATSTDRHRLDFDQGDVEVLRSVMNNMHSMVALLDRRRPGSLDQRRGHHACSVTIRS